VVDFPHRRGHHGKPHARGDQRDVGQHLVDFGDHPRCETGLAAGLDEIPVHAGGAGAAHEDERLAGQVPEADPRLRRPRILRGEPVARGQGHHQRLDGQDVVGEAALLRYGATHEADVELPRGDLLGQGGGIALVDLEVHVGMRLAEAPDQLRCGAVQPCRTGEPDGQRAGHAQRGARAAFDGVPDPRHDSLGLLAEGASPGGELDAARQPAEQRVAELTLQLLDLLRERRLLDAEGAGGTRQVAVLRHGQEVAQVSQLHRSPRPFQNIGLPYGKAIFYIFYRDMRVG